jgi:glycosyltransferase involved in cell wall biosynthesis
MARLISVVIPSHNETGRLQATIASIVQSRTTDTPVEIVVVDDASLGERLGGLQQWAVERLPEVAVRVTRSASRLGVARARNLGAGIARGDILFMTDAHVRFSRGWDQLILEHLSPTRVLAATVGDSKSGFRGYGCRLVVPFMGTRWNRQDHEPGDAIQVASACGTVLSRELWNRLEGYDEGIVLYGGAEPEFSVRTWLSGAQIVSVPELEVAHRFKSREERVRFLDRLRPAMIHNNLRFGLLYLGRLESLRMLRHFTMAYPDQVQQALTMLARSDVWNRRNLLRSRLVHPFDWFVDRFGLRDQVGGDILRG